MEYQQFIDSKKINFPESGFKTTKEFNPQLFDFQKDIVNKALEKGKFCIWGGCGCGKALMLLEWANHVCHHTQKRILILAPLSVAKQIKREADKFGYYLPKYLRQDDGNTQIVITNYEMLKYFNANDFVGVVLDESSILKGMTSKTKQTLIDTFKHTPYRLATSATPSPNDYMELGNQSEFIGAMDAHVMLSMFFTHDSSNTSKWRLKHHSQASFWNWVSNWAIGFENPKELYPEVDNYQLPPLIYTYHEIPMFFNSGKDGQISCYANTLSEQRIARKNSIQERIDKVAEIVNASDEQWLVFCDLNEESKQLHSAISNSVEVKGADKPNKKEGNIMAFINKDAKVLVSKPSIVGMGLNFQQCNNIIYASLTHSWESFYQSVRRCWRFGQNKQVNVHIVYSTPEYPVIQNIERKEVQAKEMNQYLIEAMESQYKPKVQKIAEYNPQQPIKLPSFL